SFFACEQRRACFPKSNTGGVGGRSKKTSPLMAPIQPISTDRDLAFVLGDGFCWGNFSAVLRSCGALGPLDFAQACSLAFQIAQVEKLGAADAIRAQNLDFVQHFGIEWEDSFHALAKADFAHSKAALWTIATGNDCAFKSLGALFVAFFNSYLDANCISRLNVRNVLALQLGS